MKETREKSRNRRTIRQLTDKTTGFFVNEDGIQLSSGKMPPNNVELEEAVLGAILLEAKTALPLVVEFLKPEFFYKEAHQLIYNAILRLFNRSESIDLLTVTNELKKSGDLNIIEPYYVSHLTHRIASSAHIETHARIIIQKYLQRELISICSNLIKDAYDDTVDVFDLLDNAEDSLFKLTEGNIRRNVETMLRLITEAKNEIEAARKQEGLKGIPSGFTELDRITAGWQKSNLIVIASRPGIGKTSLALSFARNAAIDFNKPVAFFSLEMSAVEIATRLIASESELFYERLKKGQLEDYEWEQLNVNIQKLSEAPIFIDDTAALTLFELRAKARKLKAQHKIELIIVDYMQLMTTSGEISKSWSREQEISIISRSLKRIAKDLDIPVIAVSQLNRRVEERADKRPQLADLRESGAIEQDADLVMLIYRPEEYGIEEDKEGTSYRGLAEIIVAKHRNGRTGNLYLRFAKDLAKFVEFGEYTTKITKASKINGTTYNPPIADDEEDKTPF